MFRIYFSILLIVISQSSSYCQFVKSDKIGEEFDVKMINDLAVSPDGKEIAFSAVGKIYIMNLSEGKPRQLSKTKLEFEFEPSFSPDGKKIVYSTWNDSGYGKIHIYDKKTKWKKTVLITSGIYRDPQFSKDGNRITYKKEIEVAKVDTINQKTEGLYYLDLKEGDPFKINSYGERPQFHNSEDKLMYQSGTYRFGSFVKTFETIDEEGSDKQTLFYGKYGHEYSISPNQNWVAWQELGKIYISSYPKSPVGLSADNASIDIKEISDLPGNNLSWSDDEKVLSWTIADAIYSVNINNPAQIVRQKVNLVYKRDIPQGILAFTNARIITMDGDEVIEHGTIIVEGNRIIDIGFDIQIPKEAHAINCSGKTIMPGLIDLDPTSNNYDYNLSPIQEWEYIEYLRSGVTTKLDGGFNIANGLANRELISAGKLLGPRLLSGGVTVAANDPDLFALDTYEHYKKSNLSFARAFGVSAIQSDVDLSIENVLIFDNVQGDTTLVKSDKLIDTIISKVNSGANAMTTLRKYTLDNAKLIGLDDELGSLESGKLADLIVIDGNPLQSIGQMSRVTHTLINGRVYECSTMSEVGHYRKRVSRTPNSAIYESLNRAMGSACCGFQH